MMQGTPLLRTAFLLASLATPADGQCNEIGKLVPSSAEEGDLVGYSFEIDGNRMAVDVGNHVTIYERASAGEPWEEVTELHPPGIFRISPSTLDGDRIVVGAVTEPFGLGERRIHIYDRDEGGPGAWGLVTTLTDPSWTPGGSPLALDGDTLIVAGPADVPGGSGIVYVHERNQGGMDQWGFVKALTASDSQMGDQFGGSLALEGDRLVVGAPGWAAAFQCTPGPYPAGKVYVLERDRGGLDNWGEVTQIRAPVPTEWEGFGSSLALDGEELLVGAPHGSVHLGLGCTKIPDDTLIPGGPAVAYLFERNQGGPDTWGLVAELDSTSNEPDEGFGLSLDLQDGRAVVGARAYEGVGGATTFERDAGGPSAWGELTTLQPSPAAAGVPLVAGFAVQLDGDRVWLSAPEEAELTGALYEFLFDGIAPTPAGTSQLVELSDEWGGAGALADDRAFFGDAGVVHVLEWSEASGWTESATLEPWDAPTLSFGQSIAAWGNRVAIGAPFPPGAVYVFEHDGSGWSSLGEKLLSPDPDDAGQFGRSLAIEDDTLAVGDPSEDDTTAPGINGSVTFFEWSGGAWVERQRVFPPTLAQNFAYDLALDGERFAVTHWASGPSGEVHIYARDEVTGDWLHEDSVEPPVDLYLNPLLDGGIGLSGDRIAVGAPGFGEGPIPSGALFTFVRQGNSWVQETALCVTSTTPSVSGDCVDLEGDVLVASTNGSAVFFDRVDGVWVNRPYVTPGGQIGFICLAENGGRMAMGGVSPTTSEKIVRFDDASLQADLQELSVSAGGTQTLGLDAGSAHADKFYFVLGSLSGTSPGIPFGSELLPLNYDPYFQITLTKPNLGPLFDSLQPLETDGSEEATFVLPAGAAIDFVGQTIHHAYLVLDYPGTGAVTFTSNAVALEFVP